MREGRPSTTAGLVCVARGVGAGAAVDPIAHTLLPGPLPRWLAGFRSPGRRAVARWLLRAASLGMVDHVSLRMAAIDAALSRAVAAGTEQVVLLGAGLDARAHRLSMPAVRVFEVDHPATQAYKRRRVDALARTCRTLEYVPVDFERDALAAQLAERGHDAARPTFWIWEGVTMYLHRAALEATLADVSARSAPASELAVSYVAPEALAFRGVGVWAVEHAFELAFSEAMVGAIPRRALHDLLAEAGWTVTSDTCSRDWASLAGTSRLVGSLFRGERLAVARRVAPAQGAQTA